MGKPRIVTLDIETAPLEIYSWGIWQVDAGLNQIKTDWSILSFSYKWLGEKEVVFHHTGGRGKRKVRDDKALLKKLHAVLDEADIVIGQNVREFDLKKIGARMLHHGMKPYSPVRVIDTKVASKQVAAFTSNRLEWTSKLTDTPKSTHAKYPGFNLWLACLDDLDDAWQEMEIYNKRDVEATEKLFIKLRPWIKGLPNVAAYSEMTVPACPKCGSRTVHKRGVQVAQAGKFIRYQCQDCGGWSRSKENVLAVSRRKALLGD